MITPVTLRTVRLAALLTLTVGAGSASAVVFTVGAEPACTHASVQAAFTAVPAAGHHIVRIANSLIYSAQALGLAGKRVTVIGGLDDCADTTPSGVTTLSGAGGGNDSVLTVTGTGNDVILEHLSIIRGDEVFDGFGGGIDFRGAGFVTLRNTSVSQNYAGYGGGINVSATNGSAELRIESGTVIFFNSAQFTGGGVRLWGDARLSMLADNTQIFDNEAIGINPQDGQPFLGFGGGIELVRSAVANIGSPGLGGYGAIYNNRARYGGGIAVIAEGNDDEWAVARLFSTDPARPVRIQNNTASQTGGGVYLNPNADFPGFSHALLCAYDFRIDGNAAQEGAAIYADADTSVGVTFGSRVQLNPTTSSFCGGPPAGSLACTVGTVCHSIDGNIARTVGGQATTGATVLIQQAGSLFADRVQWRGNHGGQALRLTHDDLDGYNGIVRNCLLADNVVTGHLLLVDDGADLQLDHCTIANNTIAAAHVIEASDDLILRRSIIDQPGKTSVTVAGDLIAEHVVATEIASLGGHSSLVQDRPRFVDPEGGNYRQLAASRGVDFAPADPDIARDFDRMPRAVDLAFVPDWSGRSDLGAFERQTLLPLVRNPGFPADLRSWSVVTPGSSTWVAEGAISPGAVYVSQTEPPGGQVIGLRKCIHLPGPSSYQLNGYGRSTGFLAQDRDYPVLVWRYRANAADCSGAPTVEGELFLPRSSSFAAAATPASFQAPAGQWTRNSTLELSLVVADGDAVAFNAVDAYFDDIILQPLLDDLIFANGFQP